MKASNRNQALIAAVLSCAFLGAVTSLVPSAIAQTASAKVYEPKAGSAERKAILDALRVPIGRTVKQKIIFQVHTLNVCDGWAWATVTALKPNGSTLGEAYLYGNAQGLMRKTNGKWRAVVSGIAGDTGVMDEAKKKYPQAPNGIFKWKE